MGAAVFTVAIVCGSIMVLHSFRLDPFVFVRDVGTYMLAVALSLYFLHDGSLSVSEGMCMLGLYLVYIGTVIWCDTPPQRTPEHDPLLPDATHAHHSVLSAIRVRDMTAHSDPDLASSVLRSPRNERARSLELMPLGPLPSRPLHGGALRSWRCVLRWYTGRTSRGAIVWRVWRMPRRCWCCG
mgnify:CR=1 FL=1